MLEIQGTDVCHTVQQQSWMISPIAVSEGVIHLLKAMEIEMDVLAKVTGENMREHQKDKTVKVTFILSDENASDIMTQ